MRKLSVSAILLLAFVYQGSQVFSKETKLQKSDTVESQETCQMLQQKLARTQVQARKLSDEEKDRMRQYKEDLERLSCSRQLQSEQEPGIEKE